ncbi:protein ENHANCED PSEUDOMONAS SUSCEPTIBILITY 1-like [Vigna umbellata]|uniref:protein ENHANCED PSEUDOMONAS SUSCEPTIBILITY 1-like n=1 Tax=Vigna umbellata TaxID=87088 RepID=UPI001F5F5DE7|nr:protein ENHANCED PSEUDOMONAS SUSCEPTIBILITY 1-like [Vigna umbellata]
MENVRVISTTTIKATVPNNANSPHTVDLTPWDLQFLPTETIQKGLLFRNVKNTPFQIHHLQHSLSSTLAFFPPLAGRLAILRHHHSIVSSHILCNNAGALFVHAVAPNTTVAHILQPKYVPLIVSSFFSINGVKNYEGTSQPLLAVQVTELVDGIFIALTVNHVVADGKSLWHFVNSWAEISRGSLHISKLPSLRRYFPDGIDHPIHFPFTEEEENQHSPNLKPQAPRERVFHFTKEKIAELKSKANAEADTDKISSLQALLTLLWRAVTRCKRVEPQENVHYVLFIGVWSRMVPALAEGYFGNSVIATIVTMKCGELLEGGLGKGALEMNKMISLQSGEKVKKQYESWVRRPRLLTLPSGVGGSNYLITSSSPRFKILDNDFGWGKAEAVRIGGGQHKRNGMITVFGGAEEGSIDIVATLPYFIHEAMGNDAEFMDVVSH